MMVTSLASLGASLFVLLSVVRVCNKAQVAQLVPLEEQAVLVVLDLVLEGVVIDLATTCNRLIRLDELPDAILRLLDRCRISLVYHMSVTSLLIGLCLGTNLGAELV